jgi:hypothetical protein
VTHTRALTSRNANHVLVKTRNTEGGVGTWWAMSRLDDTSVCWSGLLGVVFLAFVSCFEIRKGP